MSSVTSIVLLGDNSIGYSTYWDDLILNDNSDTITVYRCLGAGQKLKKTIDSLITQKTPASWWIVLADGILLAKLIARVMVLSILDKHQFSYIPGDNNHIHSIYHSPIYHSHFRGSDTISTDSITAAKVVNMPLIRDESGHILLGTAKISASKTPGEAYVDQNRIATEYVRAINIEPIADTPGLRAHSRGKFLWKSWHYGRAIQIGGEGFTVTFPDGTVYKRTLTTFYRHIDSMQIVYL